MTREHEPPHGSLQNSRPATPTEIITELDRLSLPYHRPDMTEGKWRQLFLMFCEDLKGKTLAQIQMACRRWRQGADNKFFPTPGQLLELCIPPFADKPGRSRGRIINGMEQPWGGNCQCDRCMKKTPSPEFFHAGNADHARDARIRNDLDYDMERRLGYDPKKGDPALDDTIERDRSPEDLKAAMVSARTKYPRAFNPGKPEWAADRAPIAYMPMTPERKAELLANLDKRIIEGNPG